MTQSSVTARAKELLPRLSEIARELGYSPAPDFEELGGRVRFCFARITGRYETEAICFVFHSRPTKLLTVDFVASKLSPTALAKAGLEGNAVARGLFEHQFYREGRAVDEILPSEIALDSLSSIELLDRLAHEVRSVDGKVWAD